MSTSTGGTCTGGSSICTSGGGGGGSSGFTSLMISTLMGSVMRLDELDGEAALQCPEECQVERDEQRAETCRDASASCRLICVYAHDLFRPLAVGPPNSAPQRTSLTVRACHPCAPAGHELNDHRSRSRNVSRATLLPNGASANPIAPPNGGAGSRCYYEVTAPRLALDTTRAYLREHATRGIGLRARHSLRRRCNSAALNADFNTPLHGVDA